MKNLTIVLVSLFVLLSNHLGLAQSNSELNELIQIQAKNKVDSLGQRQGKWVEYKLLPSQISINHTFKTEKDGEIVYIVFDKKIYDEKSEIITCTGQYKNGLKTGLWIKYYSNDTIKSKVEFRNGIPYGKCQHYWKNGQLKIECIIGDDFNIPVIAYDINGNKVIEKLAPKDQLIKGIYEK
ncbi:hypothetical protein BY457_1222 [Marinilabilia salmonicolor]|jgi:hypothetical protein|uniref:toxin-antitoxin system YwqK family antitoxin n=1 Tax=Marinilabilia salmonicolor TaxID=989 RepID=UPI000D06E1D7|nr:hypothetical protein [Marinilabilia salmonicolor]PRY91931.1 hypothetical protein BY457_1222 [Marinilabilia salmonicolor]